MDEWTKVRVRVDENGILTVECDGDIDKSNLTEERREAPDMPPVVDQPGMPTIWGI